MFRILLAKSEASGGGCSTEVAYRLEVFKLEKETGDTLLAIDSVAVVVDSRYIEADSGRGAKASILARLTRSNADDVKKRDLMMCMRWEGK
jgi:hypothetical protein